MIRRRDFVRAGTTIGTFSVFMSTPPGSMGAESSDLDDNVNAKMANVLDYGIKNDAVLTGPLCLTTRGSSLVKARDKTFSRAIEGMSIAIEHFAPLSGQRSNLPHLSTIEKKIDDENIELADPCPFTGVSLRSVFGTENVARVNRIYDNRENARYFWPAGGYMVTGNELLQFHSKGYISMDFKTTIFMVGRDYPIKFTSECESFEIRGGCIDTFGDALVIVRGRSGGKLRSLRLTDVVFQSTGNRRLSQPVGIDDCHGAKIVVDKCSFREGIATGLDIRWSSTGCVRNCQFEQVWRRGVFAVPTVGQGSIKDWCIENNYFGAYHKSASENAGKVPLQITRGKGEEQANNWIIRRNLFEMAAGAYDDDDQKTIYSANVLECRGDECRIEENVIIGSGDLGIEIGKSRNAIVRKNFITESDGKGINAGSMMGGTPSNWAIAPVIIDNVVKDCGFILNDEHNNQGRGEYRAGIAIKGVVGGRVENNKVINSFLRLKVDLIPLPKLPLERSVLVKNQSSGGEARGVLYWPGLVQGDGAVYPGTLTGEGTLIVSNVVGAWSKGDHVMVAESSGSVSHVRNVTNNALEVIGCHGTIIKGNKIENWTGFGSVELFAEWASRYDESHPLNLNRNLAFDTETD